jgi:hypothetical protein
MKGFGSSFGGRMNWTKKPNPGRGFGRRSFGMSNPFSSKKPTRFQRVKKYFSRKPPTRFQRVKTYFSGNDRTRGLFERVGRVSKRMRNRLSSPFRKKKQGFFSRMSNKLSSPFRKKKQGFFSRMSNKLSSPFRKKKQGFFSRMSKRLSSPFRKKPKSFLQRMTGRAFGSAGPGFEAQTSYSNAFAPYFGASEPFVNASNWWYPYAGSAAQSPQMLMGSPLKNYNGPSN